MQVILQGTATRGLFRPPYFAKSCCLLSSFGWESLTFLVIFASLLFGSLASLYRALARASVFWAIVSENVCLGAEMWVPERCVSLIFLLF